MLETAGSWCVGGSDSSLFMHWGSAALTSGKLSYQFLHMYKLSSLFQFTSSPHGAFLFHRGWKIPDGQVVRSPLFLISPKQERSWRAAVKFTRNTTHYIFHYKLTTTHYKLTTNSLHALQTHYKSTTNPLQIHYNPLQSTTFITNLLEPLLITNSSMACFECVECHGMATAQPMHQEFSSLL